MAAMAQKHRTHPLAAAASAIALCSAGAGNLALAACSFALEGTAIGEDIGGGRYLVQYTPAGHFTPSDGRKMDVPSWYIDAKLAAQVIARHDARGRPTVIDYEHQTLHKEKNGQPAPAAGWLHRLRWIEGRGLFGEVEWTDEAKALIAAKKYRYFSPVFEYARPSGHVLAVHMGAITNDPGLSGLEPLSLLAAATAAIFHKEPPVNPLLAALLATLGLPESTDEKAAIAALTAVGSIKDLQAKAAAAEHHAQVATAVCTALALPADAKPETVTAALTAATGKADPTRYVPVETVQQLQTQIAALTAKQQEAEIDALIQPALEDGRLLPALEPWARDLGKSNMAALTSYLKKQQPIAALTGTQTKGHPPATTAKGDAQLSAQELAVCSAMGLSPEQYKAGAA